jgi:hypothetical protein
LPQCYSGKTCLSLNGSTTNITNANWIFQAEFLQRTEEARLRLCSVLGLQLNGSETIELAAAISLPEPAVEVNPNDGGPADDIQKKNQ